jgi:diguanylate cyclase (GGDEF)-like protein/PAS domain S-box-containing protein
MSVVVNLPRSPSLPLPPPRIAAKLREHDAKLREHDARLRDADAAKPSANDDRLLELEEQLATHFPLYQRAVEESHDGLVVLDRRARIVFCNPAAAVLFNATCAEMIGREFGFPVGTLNEATAVEIVTRGKPLYVEMRATAISWEGADASLVVLRDVTARREAEAQIFMQTKALEATANGIYITDKAGLILWTNRAFETMTGYTTAEMSGKSVTLFKSSQHDEAFYADIWSHLLAGEVWKGRVVNSRKDASLYTSEQTITPVRDATGRLSHFVAIQEDLSERLKAQGELTRLTEVDTLTGLPNRQAFMERLQAAIERAHRAESMVAVMLMDLDNFKSINNTLGHSVGDALLVAVSAQILKIMRTTDTLAHLGGDDFGIILENVKDMAAASRMMRKILDSFHRPLHISVYRYCRLPEGRRRSAVAAAPRRARDVSGQGRRPRRLPLFRQGDGCRDPQACAA